MPSFASKEELVAVLSALWEEIFRTPQVVEKIGDEKLIVKFRFTDFPTSLFIDNTGQAPRYHWDPADDTVFDVEMIQSSEVSHQFWMETLNVPLAIATRKIVAKGSVQKALKLIPALKPAFALYPRILKEMGRGDLLPASDTHAQETPELFFFQETAQGHLFPGADTALPVRAGRE